MRNAPKSHESREDSQRYKDKEIDNISDFRKENPVSKAIVDCAFKVHTTLGAGLLESAYEECMEKEFIKRKIRYKKQFQMPIYYEGELLNTPYRVDFLIEECVIIELKSVEKILPVHQAQLLTYMKLSKIRMGLLMNFSSPLIKDGIKRLVL